MSRAEQNAYERALRGLRALRRYYRRRAPFEDGDFFIDQLVAGELIPRCADLSGQPRLILDFGSRLGSASEALRGQFPNAVVVALDCEDRLMATGARRPGADLLVASDGWPVPLKDSSFDLIVINLSASFWPIGMIAEAIRLLRSGGALLISAFGSRTLAELREQSGEMGFALRCDPGHSTMDLGGEILGSGGSEPVVDSRLCYLGYEDIDSLRRDFQRAGISLRARATGPARSAAPLSCPGELTVEILTAVAFKP